jgi:hypothetical protein
MLDRRRWRGGEGRYGLGAAKRAVELVISPTMTVANDHDDSMGAIAAEAKAIDSARRNWRTFDRATALDLGERMKLLRKRISALRKKIEPDADADHDALHDLEEPLGDALTDVERSLRSQGLAAEAPSVADEVFLDWLEERVREGLPVKALWDRATLFFGKSRGRAERIFADDAWEDVPDQTSINSLLVSAAAQGDSRAAVALMRRQPERRDEWFARAIELRDQNLCLNEGRELVRPPRTPERLARAAELFSWAILGQPGRAADEAYAYLSCLHRMRWLSENAPKLPQDFRISDPRILTRVRKQFGL